MSTTSLHVQESPVAGQQTHGGKSFPVVMKYCDGNASLPNVLSWVHEQRDTWDRLAALHGAILFRSFPLQTAQDFDAFVTAFELPNFAYDQSLSNAVRVNRTERVFTANEAPPEVTIYLHHEMAQTPVYPSKLFFFCEQAAETGGATPLCRSDVLWKTLLEKTPLFAHDCETKGLKYTNTMPAEADLASGMGRSWQSTLNAASRREAEQRLGKLGYTWQWLGDGSLRATTPVLPAVRELSDGRKTFFNQLIAASQGWKDSRNDPSKAITYGDGTPLDHAGVMQAVRLAEEITFDLPWQTGDVALVDNFVTMHGRRSFSGMRKVLASLVADESA